MDVYKEWEQLNQKIFSNESLKKEEIMNAIKSESVSAIHQIKKGLIIKSFWAVGFIVLFTTLMFFSGEFIEAVIAVGIINLIYLISFILLVFMVKRINTNILGKDNILQNLQVNAKIIKKALMFEGIVFVFNMPVIILCSMSWGSLIRGNTFNSLLNNSRFLTLAIVMCIILVPISYFLGKFLNKKSFGPHLDKMNDNITKLLGVEMIKDIVD